MGPTDRPAGQIAVVGASARDPRWLTILGGQCLAHATLVAFPEQGIDLSVLALAAPEAERVPLAGPGPLSADAASRLLAAAENGARVVCLSPAARWVELRSRPPAPWAQAPVPILWVPPGDDPLPTAEPAAAVADPCRPLCGMRVLLTRPRHQIAGLWDPLVGLGAEVLVQPAIHILPPDDWTAVDAALQDLDRYAWLVFSSANGVSAVVQRLWAIGRDLRALASRRLAAIGPGTADELARFRLRADLVPDEFRAEALADALKQTAAAGRFLLVRASRGREVLADELRAAGAQVDQVVVYRSLDADSADPLVCSELVAGRIAWTTVTSSAIARSLVRLFGADLRRTKLVSISPITSATLRELGYPPAAEAGVYTMEGLVEALVQAVRRAGTAPAAQ